MLLLLQEKMYLCSANCCQNNSYTMEDVGRCVEACNQPVSQTQTFLQNELNSFQVCTPSVQTLFLFLSMKNVCRHRFFRPKVVTCVMSPTLRHNVNFRAAPVMSTLDPPPSNVNKLGPRVGPMLSGGGARLAPMPMPVPPLPFLRTPKLC